MFGKKSRLELTEDVNRINAVLDNYKNILDNRYDFFTEEVKEIKDILDSHYDFLKDISSFLDVKERDMKGCVWFDDNGNKLIGNPRYSERINGITEKLNLILDHLNLKYKPSKETKKIDARLVKKSTRKVNKTEKETEDEIGIHLDKNFYKVRKRRTNYVSNPPFPKLIIPKSKRNKFKK